MRHEKGLAISEERTLRAWNKVLIGHEVALKEGDHATVDESEQHLLRIASTFLLGHGKGDLRMPQDVALWLHRVLEDARIGFPLPSVRQRVGGRSKSEAAAFAEAYAVAYVRAAEAGRIHDPDPKTTVMAAFRMTVDRKYYRWLKARYPTPALGMTLEERSPETRTAWAKRFLTYLGAEHYRLTQKRR